MKHASIRDLCTTGSEGCFRVCTQSSQKKVSKNELYAILIHQYQDVLFRLLEMSSMDILSHEHIFLYVLSKNLLEKHPSRLGKMGARNFITKSLLSIVSSQNDGCF